MTEKCEACGRFGAQRGTYRHYNQSLGKTCIAYLCPRCDKLQCKADTAAELIERIEQLRRDMSAVRGSPAESAIADQLAVELANLRAINPDMYKQVKRELGIS